MDKLRARQRGGRPRWELLSKLGFASGISDPHRRPRLREGPLAFKLPKAGAVRAGELHFNAAGRITKGQSRVPEPEILASGPRFVAIESMELVENTWPWALEMISRPDDWQLKYQKRLRFLGPKLRGWEPSLLTHIAKTSWIPSDFHRFFMDFKRFSWILH